MKVKIVYLLFLIVFFGSNALAQSKADMAEEANLLLEAGEFEKAYPMFDQLSAKSPKNIDYKFKLGICCLNYPEKKDRAIDVFEDLKKNLKTSSDVSFYLGKAYHINYQFDKAIKELTDFKQNNRNSSKEEKRLNKEADILLSNCKNGKALIENKVIAHFTNLGAPVNSDDEEYVPAITTDESIMLFTYRGKKSVGGKLNRNLEPDETEGFYNEDVYITTRTKDSSWSAPIAIESVNTKGNDAAISVSADGRLLFTFRSDEKNSGDIYMSVLTGTTFSKPEPLNNNINSEHWEGSCSISADGRLLYFSSERPGGYGGKDIWVSEKVNGDWGPAVNLGPKINTPLDDDAPFIHPDGITMFFSSKGHSSIGGYDIMFSIFKENDWLEPRNMGIPLNTTEDDIYYVINSRGDKGYFSSDRAKSGGKGKQDIYMVQPGILGEKPVIALLKGVVYGDDKPIEATIEVTKNNDTKIIGPYFSNNLTGKYLMAISPGSVYRIKVVAEGYESIVEDFDVEKLDKYLELNKDFYLYKNKPADTVKVVTTPTVVNTPTVANTQTTTNTPTVAVTPTVTETPTLAVNEKAKPCEGKVLPDFTSLKGKSLNIPEYYSQLLSMAGDYCSEGMIFKVQIAAYRKPENYKYSHLKQYGEPEVVNYPDGITRFTQLQFTTIKDAEKHRQKAIAKGQTDAWIVGFVNGKRYTLEELIMLDFLGKSIN